MSPSNPSFDAFYSLKDQLLSLMSEAETWLTETDLFCDARAQTATIRAKRSDLEQDQFSLVVVGEFSSGKSFFINLLMDRIYRVTTRKGTVKAAGLLPDRLAPTTSTITVLRQGAPESARVIHVSGHEAQIALDAIEPYLAEEAHRDRWEGVPQGSPVPRLGDPIDRVEIRLDAPFLENGVTVVDTPGVGSVIHEHAAITSAYIPRADAILFLFAVQPPINNEARLFLSQCLFHTDRFLFVQTMKDQEWERDGTGNWRPAVRNGEDVHEAATRQNRAILASVLGYEPHVYSISARWAAWHRLELEAPPLELSGVPALMADLERFLVRNRGRETLRHHASVTAATLRTIDSRLDVARAQTGKTLEEIERLLAEQEPVVREIERHAARLEELVEHDLTEAMRRCAGYRETVLENLRAEVHPRVDSLTHRQFADCGAMLGFYVQNALNRAVRSHARDRVEPTIQDLGRRLRQEGQALQSALSRLAEVAGGLSEVSEALWQIEQFRVPLPDTATIQGRMETSITARVTAQLGGFAGFLRNIPRLGDLVAAFQQDKIEAVRRQIAASVDAALQEHAEALTRCFEEFLKWEGEIVRRQIRELVDRIVETYNGSLKRAYDERREAHRSAQEDLQRIEVLQARGRALIQACSQLIEELPAPIALSPGITPMAAEDAPAVAAEPALAR